MMMSLYGNTPRLANTLQSLYAIVNNRGVKQVFTPVVWKINVAPRIHIFLWLFANNKILTRDNLAKRKNLDDKTCLFCKEDESIHHIFFDCCAAKVMWQFISEITDFPMISDFEYLGSLWLKGKKLIPFNVCTSAVLWIIWKTRNNICFQGPAGQRWKRCLAGVRSCTGTRRC
jgi:hypothetical protein